MSKKALRQQIRLKRKQKLHNPMVQAAHHCIRAGLDHFIQSHPQQKLGLFWPTRDEIDIRPLIEKYHRSRQIALPKTAGKRLTFHIFTGANALIPGPFGISEPPAEAPTLHPAIIITPLLAYDQSGYRLGYGGGYYDRAFAGPYKNALKVGIGLSIFGYDKLPIDKHDIKLDLLINEKETLDFRD